MSTYHERVCLLKIFLGRKISTCQNFTCYVYGSLGVTNIPTACWTRQTIGQLGILLLKKSSKCKHLHDYVHTWFGGKPKIRPSSLHLIVYWNVEAHLLCTLTRTQQWRGGQTDSSFHLVTLWNHPYGLTNMSMLIFARLRDPGHPNYFFDRFLCATNAWILSICLDNILCWNLELSPLKFM